MVAGYRDFEFPLAQALLRELVKLFDGMESAPLAMEALSGIPDAQGVYLLQLKGKPVYVGKTDGGAGLSKRLSRHAQTVRHRRNLASVEVSFKAIRVQVFTAVDLETLLIHHYGKDLISWNYSGFGSNDPGRRRDGTFLKSEGFDAQFPIDLDIPYSLDTQGEITVARLLTLLKNRLPYVVRFETVENARRPHPELESSRVMLDSTPKSTRQFLEVALPALPPGWQATALPGRVILYKETKDYVAGSVIARS